MRAAIYARYSSDLQSEASIDDQVRICRERIKQLNGTVADVYSDAAISGARLQNRPGIQALLAAARTKPLPFDTIFTEALDRLSRDQEDIAGLFKRLNHLDVEIHTLSEGVINELHVGLKGTMNALFLKDLAAKVRRGQRGRVEAKRAAGGLSYGYRVIREIGLDGEIERGKREIDDAQSKVILRIFKEYVSGRSPRAIATRLNQDGIPGPRGGAWNASSINGNRQRLHGIIQNPLYAGKMLYGRLTYRKNPDTGTREVRVVAQEKWVPIEMPEWQIVPTDLWNAAQKIRNRHAAHGPHTARRPRHLLSGLIQCGICGGAFTMRSSDRLGCVAHREKGTCRSNRTIKLRELELRVLGGIKERLLNTDIFEEFRAEYNAELRRIEDDRADLNSDVERQLINIRAKIGRVVDAIADGAESGTLRLKLAELEMQKARLESETANSNNQTEIIELCPDFAKLYRNRIAELESLLAIDTEEGPAARQILRSLIDRIVVHPGDRRGRTEIDVFGRVASILQLGNQPLSEAVHNVGVGKVVPGGGIEPPTP